MRFDEAFCLRNGRCRRRVNLARHRNRQDKDEPKVLKDYASAGGRGRITKMVVAGVGISIGQTFEAALNVLHYWRDDAAHGMATTIVEVEAYVSLTQLLRLAQFCSDRWQALTA